MKLVLHGAAYRETDMRTPVKLGERACGPIPSQASEEKSFEEGVETLWQVS